MIGAGAITKKDGALFGPSALQPVPSRTRSLSPGSKNSSGPFKYEDKRLPNVPPKNEKPVMGIRTNKNFITANAVEAILQGIFLRTS